MLEAASASELSRLASEIQRHHTATLDHALEAREHTRSGLGDAVKCGLALIEAHNLVPYGQWRYWLSQNCPSISKSSANNYIKLANSLGQHVGQLEGVGLRDGYKLAGIIAEPKFAKKTPKELKWSEKADADPLDTATFDPFGDLDKDGSEDAEAMRAFAEYLVRVLQWIIKGQVTTVGQRAVALGWVMGIFDSEPFGENASLPSLTEVATTYNIDPPALSRFAAEVSRVFPVKNRAQAHGDGVRRE